MSLLHIDITQVIEILPHVRQELTYSTLSMLWLLMFWRRKESGRQQQWSWVCWTELIQSPHIKGEKHICISHHSLTLKCHRLFKFTSQEYLYCTSQYQVAGIMVADDLVSGDTTSQGISGHGIDQVHPGHSFSIKTIFPGLEIPRIKIREFHDHLIYIMGISVVRQYLYIGSWKHGFFNTLRPRQNGRHFADDVFICIFLNENVWILLKISLKFVPKGPINNIPALVQIMAWRRPGDKPLCEPVMVRLPTHICVTRPQWVNHLIVE